MGEIRICKQLGKLFQWFVGCYKYVRQNRKIVEVVGLILVLTSFSFQLIESDIESELKEAQHYEISNKLDMIWGQLGEEYRKSENSNPIDLEQQFTKSDKYWKYYDTSKEELNDWKTSVWFSYLVSTRVWIFILGSGVLIVAKCLEKN